MPCALTYFSERSEPCALDIFSERSEGRGPRSVCPGRALAERVPKRGDDMYRSAWAVD